MALGPAFGSETQLPKQCIAITVNRVHAGDHPGSCVLRRLEFLGFSGPLWISLGFPGHRGLPWCLSGLSGLFSRGLIGLLWAPGPFWTSGRPCTCRGDFGLPTNPTISLKLSARKAARARKQLKHSGVEESSKNQKNRKISRLRKETPNAQNFMASHRHTTCFQGSPKHMPGAKVCGVCPEILKFITGHSHCNN